MNDFNGTNLKSQSNEGSNTSDNLLKVNMQGATKEQAEGKAKIC